MEKKTFDRNIAMQVSFLVCNIEKTSRAFAALLGMDNPGWHLVSASQVYPPGAKRALFPWADDVAIEIVEPGEQPSSWRQRLNEYGEGIHCVTFFQNSAKETIIGLRQKELRILQQDAYGKASDADLDVTEQLQLFLKLLEGD